MANSIRNSHGRSVLHIDTTDGEITLAELKASVEEIEKHSNFLKTNLKKNFFN